MFNNTYQTNWKYFVNFQAKCNFFKNTDAQNAFKALIDVLVSENPVPNYNQVLAILDSAISSIESKSKPERIDWMGRATDATPSKGSKYSKLMSGISKSMKR